MDELIEAEKRQREAVQRYPSRAATGGAKVVRTVEEPRDCEELTALDGPTDLGAALAEPMPEGAEADQEIVQAIQADQAQQHQAIQEQQLSNKKNGTTVSAFVGVPGAVVWEAPCRRRIDPGQLGNPADPDDRYALPIVFDLRVRLVAGERTYSLELFEDGQWNQVFSAYSPDGCMVGASFWQLDILGTDLEAVSRLPRVRPAEAARRAREEAAMLARSIVSLRR
jgi:hypothetical protein